MELRHLRYFVAVAEEGSLTYAAERRLHTAQPSLSRQMRDLELEIGAQLFQRGARGIVLTAAGRIFYDQARIILLQVEVASEAARKADQPGKQVLVIGFLAGQELVWLPEVLRIVREEAPGVEVMISNRSSPELALALAQGKVDLAFLRREPLTPGLAFIPLVKEPLIALLPARHSLARDKVIRPQALSYETYINSTSVAPVVASAIDGYTTKTRASLQPEFSTETIAAAVSLIASTGGFTLCPSYGKTLLTPNVVARPLEGKPPMIEVVMGYNKSNTPAPVKRFLGRAEELAYVVSKKRPNLNYLRD
jgi:LysR family hca operon transcriptional activator